MAGLFSLETRIRRALVEHAGVGTPGRTIVLNQKMLGYLMSETTGYSGSLFWYSKGSEFAAEFWGVPITLSEEVPDEEFVVGV